MTCDDYLEYIFHDPAFLSSVSSFRGARNVVFRHIEELPSFIIWRINSGEASLSVWNAVLGKPIKHYIFPVLTDDNPTDIHQHDYIELLYVMQGQIRQNIAGVDYIFHEKDVILINHDIMYYDYVPNRDTCVLWLNIPDSLFRNLFQNSIHSPYQNFVASLLLTRRRDYSHLHGSPKSGLVSPEKSQTALSILEIAREIVLSGPGSSHIIKGHLIRLIYHLALEYQFRLQDYSYMDMRRLLFEEISQDIMDNCRDITVDWLKNKYYFNIDYFNRLIREYSGITFHELRQMSRLEEAERLLLETDMNIDDISRSVGYENTGYFYKLFSDRFGMTPRKYRKTRN